MVEVPERAVSSGDIVVVSADDDRGADPTLLDGLVEGHGKPGPAHLVRVEDPRLGPHHHLVLLCLIQPPEVIRVLLFDALWNALGNDLLENLSSVTKFLSH